MALIQCPECQHDVSTQAASCPNGGYVFRPTLRPRSLLADPDLARLVKRERQWRAWWPFTIALAVIVVIIGGIAASIQVFQSH